MCKKTKTLERLQELNDEIKNLKAENKILDESQITCIEVHYSTKKEDQDSMSYRLPIKEFKKFKQKIQSHNAFVISCLTIEFKALKAKL
jgi:hypothetical protein